MRVRPAMRLSVIVSSRTTSFLQTACHPDWWMAVVSVVVLRMDGGCGDKRGFVPPLVFPARLYTAPRKLHPNLDLAAW